MTVDKIDENKLLVILYGEDMEDFSLDFDTLSLNDLHSRKMLLKIMQLACKRSGMEVRGRSVSIEALYLDGRCCLLLTLDEKRGSASRKKTGSCVCCRFDKTDSFLGALEKLYRMNIYCNKNSAYFYNGCYYIIFDYPSVPAAAKRVLSEYGEKCVGSVAAARIKENGKLICGQNAIYRIGGCLV